MNTYNVPVVDFSLEETLECGQCFRWRRNKHGGYTGIVYDRRIELSMDGDTLIISGCTPEDYDSWLAQYLGLNQDYGSYKLTLSADETLKNAIGFAPGIRVMRQELWETLCSFIISQNNNIPRISGIIDRLCEGFGRDCGGYYSFPSAAALARLTAEDLAPLRAGFRAGYIIDAAQKVAAGAIDEETIKNAPLNEARAVLMQIRGVGPKVAECTLLFGAGRYDAFPEDVWIKRAMAQLFPNGLPGYALPIAGIAQQYIFHYARKSGAVK